MHGCDALCTVQTFMTGPHAVLVEGGLAHCMHFMLTHQPLDSLVNTPKLLEAQLKLLNAVMLTVPLQVLLHAVLACFGTFASQYRESEYHGVLGKPLFVSRVVL